MFYVILSSGAEVPVAGKKLAIAVQKAELNKVHAYNACAQRHNKRAAWNKQWPWKFTEEMEEQLALIQGFEYLTGYEKEA